MILHGDCLSEMRAMEDNSVDSIVTDPPYGLTNPKKQKALRDLKIEMKKYEIEEPLEISDIMYRDMIYSFGKTSPYGKPSAEEIQIAEKWYADNPPHPKLTELEKKYDNLRKSGGGFMGKKWDNTGIAYNVDMWKECLRVLKPGGHLLSFGGTRTYHRMASAIEDAGFEVRDMIEWVYGSGFPKSLNIGKAVDKMQGNEREEVGDNPNDRKTRDNNLSDYGLQGGVGKGKLTKGTSEWEGWGTALKPAHEPICMARKPLAEKTVAENVLKYGTGGINIDESRVDFVSKEDKAETIGKNKHAEYKNSVVRNSAKNGIYQPDNRPPENYEPQGRFPANLIHDNSEEVRECFPDAKGASSQNNHSNGKIYRGQSLLESETKLEGHRDWYNDNGNASRFFKSIPQGRFPANLIHDNSEEVRACFPETKSGGKKVSDKANKDGLFGYGGQVQNDLEASSGNASRFFRSIKKPSYIGKVYGKTDGRSYLQTKEHGVNYKNTGNPAEYFKSIIYQAKASKSERNKGCEGLEEKKQDLSRKEGNVGGDNPRNRGVNKRKNHHPTVKPIKLMQYLVRLITPPGGIVLDPFMGSGTTGIACKKEGFEFIGVELDEDYFKIAKARIEKLEHQHELF